MTLHIDVEQESDGRWIAEVTELPGTMVYGSERHDAILKARVLAFRVLADRLEHGESLPDLDGVFAESA